MKNFEKPYLILASKSPRRKYLLEKAGIHVKVIPSTIDESAFKLTSPKSYVKLLSQAKAYQVSEQYPEYWVLGADTIVVIDDMILGKPEDRAHARQMLQALSGQIHKVYTGFSLYHSARGKQISDVVVTDVQFKMLCDAEIDWYISTGEPFDKAGAYAIQGIGTFIVKSINGSYSNVVGLPICEVIEVLLREGIEHLRTP